MVAPIVGLTVEPWFNDRGIKLSMKWCGMASLPLLNAILSCATKGLLGSCDHILIGKQTDVDYSYVHEANTYERIYQKRPQGFEFFANLLAHGKIACSSLFPTGYILIITKVPGHPLIEQWSNLYTHEKAYVYFQVKKAIDILRSISMISVDSGMHNILYSPMSERVTMHDFEIMQGCDQNTINTDMPELFAIFGQMAVEESHRDFFGN